MKRLMQLCVLILLLGSAHAVVAAPSLIDHYRKALASDPQNQTLRYHFGVALLNRGQDREALAAFRTAYPFRAGDPEMNFNLALVYARLKDPDSALLYLDQALANGAGDEPEIYPLQNVYFNLVLLYEQQERLADARALLQRLVDENPSRFEYLRLLGDYQLRLGEVDAAIETLDLYLRQMPEDTEMREYLYAALYNRALAAYEAQDLEGARREFSRAQRFSGANSDIPYYLALFDYQQQKYARVVEQLPAIYAGLTAEQQTNARSILYNSALALKQQGEFAAARLALQPLSSAVPPRAKDLALLAGIELRMGDFAAARTTYLRVLQVEPGHATAADGMLAAEKGAFNQVLDTAGKAFAAGDLSAVRAALEQAAGIYPQDNRLRIYQARLAKASRDGWLAMQTEAEALESRQRYVEALQAVRDALALAPTEPQLLQREKRLVRLLAKRISALYDQGKTEVAAGELLRARERFEQLLRLSPAHVGAKEFLQRIDQERLLQAQRDIGAGDAALERGELIAARRYFRQALELRPGEAAAVEGLKRSEQLLKAGVAEVLVRVRREESAGDLVAAQALLREAFGRWADAALQQELKQVDEALDARRTTLAQLAREAIRQQQFDRADSLLTQVESLGMQQELQQLHRELQEARRGAVDSQLDFARREVAAGRYDVGLKAFRRVLDIDPGNAEAQQGIRQGRDELSKVISGYLAEGGAAHQAGQFEQARRAYREVLILDPHQDEALTALRQIERADRSGLSAADVERLYLQGISLYTEGDYRQAIVVWRQVIDLEPGHEKARMNIDKAERKLRQIEERQHG